MPEGERHDLSPELEAAIRQQSAERLLASGVTGAALNGLVELEVAELRTRVSAQPYYPPAPVGRGVFETMSELQRQGYEDYLRLGDSALEG